MANAIAEPTMTAEVPTAGAGFLALLRWPQPFLRSYDHVPHSIIKFKFLADCVRVKSNALDHLQWNTSSHADFANCIALVITRDTTCVWHFRKKAHIIHSAYLTFSLLCCAAKVTTCAREGSTRTKISQADLQLGGPASASSDKKVNVAFEHGVLKRSTVRGMYMERVCANCGPCESQRMTVFKVTCATPRGSTGAKQYRTRLSGFQP